MKCPKCGYLGFERVERCRHCGYEFSLSTAVSRDEPELPIRVADETVNPLDDLSLIDSATAPPPRVPMTDAGPDLDRVFGAPDTDIDAAAPSKTARASRASASWTEELPLFGAPIADDQPLITRASPPRAPLAVRRATPETARLRADQPRPQSFDLELDDVPDRPAAASVTPAARATTESWPDPYPERAENAAIGARFLAVVIDLVILAAIDAAVVYFTMQICGLALSDVGILPKVPLLAFMLVQNGGYLVAFTAGGQTLGKMTTGIKVVGTESAGALDFGRAVVRTIIWLMLAAPAGLGFLTLFSRDHRGLHDRFAGTRVVRASA
jgi:uncharacterized RDD family membrane protein YckC